MFVTYLYSISMRLFCLCDNECESEHVILLDMFCVGVFSNEIIDILADVSNK